MTTTHNLGYPRIGARRELKFALEALWHGKSSEQALQETAAGLRAQNWQEQASLSLAPAGDFSLYDQVLDMSATLGNLPERASAQTGSALDAYFRVARGRSPNDSACCSVHAGEMTKWFDTNYHYIVPEFDAGTSFSLNADRILEQLAEARAQGINAKPVIIGPVTYLWLGKAKDDSDRLNLLNKLLPVYTELLTKLAEAGAEWVQIDEPALVTELDADWRHAFILAYHELKTAPVKLLLTTYFGELRENLQLACELPVAGIHLDAISAQNEVARLADWLPVHKVLSLGVINGRNIWKTDLNATLDLLEPLKEKLGERLWLAPSCSLLHVPVDLESETTLDSEIRNWLAFARQKLQELNTLAKALEEGRGAVAQELGANQKAIDSRRKSARVHNPAVSKALAAITPEHGQRKNPFSARTKLQQERFQLPAYPTTTIGSFPQTPEIREVRKEFRQGNLSQQDYTARIREEIAYCVEQQEALGLDVLVHGEAERNDMVEYFGEQLEGYRSEEHTSELQSR